jgi:hypothetical protein
VSGLHQSLLHCVGQSESPDAAVLPEARASVLPAIEPGGPMEAWILDDPRFPEQGIRLGWRGSIVGSSANGPTAKPR